MYDHPNPIYLDFETQSSIDIKEVGGRIYVEHPSTRILILACKFDNTFHVWIPDYIGSNIPFPNRLWPHKLQPSYEVNLYRGNKLPRPILESTYNRPIIAHNAFAFDKLLWERFLPDLKCEWLDSLYLSRASGLPGKLDDIGKRLLGEGKHKAKDLMPELCVAKPSYLGNGYVYPNIKPGDLQAFTTYAISDVEIMARVWKTFDDLEVETDVINVHNIINQRGIKADKELLRTIQNISDYSIREASKEINKLTRGQLNESNIRSTKQVHEWLGNYGITITDDNGKPCLRKDIVQRFIDSPYLIESNLSAAVEIPPVVIDVLRLRMKALRITDAKVKRALERISSDGRIRDLIQYWIAGTGRFSSHGVQIHNLPRPDERINIQHLLTDSYINDKLFYKLKDAKLQYEHLQKYISTIDVNESNPLTVDDICSALIRPSFVPEDGNVFVPCDYSQVEARGIAWIADDYKAIKNFSKGIDPYINLAVKVFGHETIENFHKQSKDLQKLQRQVCKNAELGLGYGMGPHKFRIYAALNKADLVKAGVTAEQVVNIYRDEHTPICGFKPNEEMYASFRVNGVWQKLDKAVKECVATGNSQEAGKCYFSMKDRNLLMRLPSDRVIYYNNARIEDIIPPYVYVYNLPPVPKATVVYDSNRGVKSLFGGLIAENIVQAICRDLMCIAMVKMEDENIPVVLHVHDEIVSEVKESIGEHTLKCMVQIMSEVPQWATGFPIACEGFITPRFVKTKWEGYNKLTTKDLQNKQLIIFK